jgi:hypothetical protein
MPSSQYLIVYPNGIKRHVTRQELALLSGSLTQTGPHEYSAASLQASIEQTNGPHYLAGSFIFEHKGKKTRELLESPRGMVERLERNGALTCDCL